MRRPRPPPCGLPGRRRQRADHQHRVPVPGAEVQERRAPARPRSRRRWSSCSASRSRVTCSSVNESTPILANPSLVPSVPNSASTGLRFARAVPMPKPKVTFRPRTAERWSRRPSAVVPLHHDPVREQESWTCRHGEGGHQSRRHLARRKSRAEPHDRPARRPCGCHREHRSAVLKGPEAGSASPRSRCDPDHGRTSPRGVAATGLRAARRTSLRPSSGERALLAGFGEVTRRHRRRCSPGPVRRSPGLRRVRRTSDRSPQDQ